MESKMVTRKRKEAARLRRAAKTFIEEVVPGLEERLSPFLAKGERPPELALLAVLAARRVDWRLERLITADAANHAAKASLSHLRDHRDDLCATVRRPLSELRDLSRSLSRRWPQAARYDLGEVPVQPHLLLRYARIELDLLRKQLPLPEGGPVRFEPAGFVAELKAPVAALGEVLEEIEGKLAAASIALEGKMRAQAGFELECGVGLKVLAAFSALVGER